MLAFAHIPTGTTANTGIDIDESKSKIVASAIALTAIGADLKPGGATPKEAAPAVAQTGSTSDQRRHQQSLSLGVISGETLVYDRSRVGACSIGGGQTA
jgi:hypothetical protein